MARIDTLVDSIKTELNKTESGRRMLGAWTDSRIRQELRDPCFFGVKSEIKEQAKAVNHFKRIATARERLSKS